MKNIKQITSMLLLSSVMFSASAFAEEAPKKNAEMPAPKADIFIVEQPKVLPILLQYPGVTKPFQKVKVVSRALGILETKSFEEGQKVKQGDLLYKIEDDTYLAKVEAAEASLQMVEATLNNNTRNWQRIEKLFKQKVISHEERDTALSTYQESLAAVSLAKAQLAQAKIDLEYTKVKAPISGTIGLKMVDIGDIVTQNPPKELTTITQNDKVYVEFSMPLSDYKNIKDGMWALPENGKIKINILIDGVPAAQTGVVDFIDVNINQSTSTVQMRALVDNQNGYLMPGNFVRVSLNGIAQKNVITIPQKAMLQNPLGTVVFVENEGNVSMKPVVVGNESGDNYIVVGGPLQSGDRVIVNNFFKVKPGGKVVVDKIINQQGK